MQEGRGGWQGRSGRSVNRPCWAHSPVVAPHIYCKGLRNPITVSRDTFPQICKGASLPLEPSTPCSQHVLCF